MIKDDIINVKTCVLKVSINCQACMKKVKRIIHKVDGVYQSTVNRDGKVTVSGLMDPDMVIKKLKKAGKRAELWGAEPQMLSHPQKIPLGTSGDDQQPKDVDKVQRKAGANVASSSGESRGAAKDVMPEATPQQLLRQQMMKALMVPSGPKGMGGNGKTSSPVAAPPAKDPKAFKFNIPEEEEFEDNGEFYDGSDIEDLEDDGLNNDDAIPITMPSATLVGNKRGGGTKEIPVQVKAKANNTGKVVPAMKQNLGGGVRIANNGGGAQPPPNSKAGDPSGRNKPGQANKVGGTGGLPTGVRGPKMGSKPPSQQPGMVIRPPNMMGSGAAAYPGMSQMGGWPMGGMPTGHPHMASNGMQPGGSSAIVHGTAAGGMMPGAGFYPGGAGGSIAVGMASAPEQYMPMMPQHQPQMMMNCHGPHCHHVHGGAGYLPQMGCGYGHPPAYYPPMPRHPHDNMFSDENPNSYCSVM